jgi:hypothetical protein
MAQAARVNALACTKALIAVSEEGTHDRRRNVHSDQQKILWIVKNQFRKSNPASKIDSCPPVTPDHSSSQ